MDRVLNFSAGPSVLPLPVLEKVQSELLNYGESGMSVMEMSHRSPEFEAIIEKCESLLREIMGIPNEYEVLFLQGGASTQFAMIPLNLLTQSKICDYVNTGTWSKKAISEARKYGQVNVIATSENENFTCIPTLTKQSFTQTAEYIHITTNNTIEGTCYQEIPDTGGVPLIADMSSDILSKPYDVSKFGLIYAGAQKNLGPAGVTLVIIRKDLIKEPTAICPTMLAYQTHAKGKSLYNTPPTFSIYVMMHVLEWVKESGGVEAIYQENLKKAKLLYDFLDQSSMFKAIVLTNDRSIMNIPFTTASDELNKAFLREADQQGFKNLKGHRLVGGMRASLYNAMPLEGVEKLVHFMDTFEKEQ